MSTPPTSAAVDAPVGGAGDKDREPAVDAAAPRRRKRRTTGHLKLVPESLEQRESLRERCRQTAAKLDKSHPLDKGEMERVARGILSEAGQPEGYLGWMMVVLASEFWREQIGGVPPERRLLLLPHCLKHAEGCPADYDEFGLDCRRCGACEIADFRTIAEDLGYKVLVAEGSPIVMKIIVSGYIDAIVGVACLNVLEKAIDKVLLAGIPCMAVPLLSSDCRNTSVDADWVSEMIHVRNELPTESTRTYLHLLRGAKRLFEPDELDRLLPRRRSDANGEVGDAPPLASTEAIAHDFLARGGKYSRPFITLAAYDAAGGGDATRGDLGSGEGAAAVDGTPDAVRRVALAIETFHKASLVHDDIQDGDDHRYGAPALHKQHGVATAINAGDYLIGLGYRMVAADAAPAEASPIGGGGLGADAAADILHKLAESHTRLCEGQGAELRWRDGADKRITPLDALQIYALKTSPAFEAAMFGGLRAAGPVGTDLATAVRELSKHLGVAFQILNDLKDWRGDQDNKLAAGGDVLGGRPTLLLALALEASDDVHANELLGLVGSADGPAAVERVRVRYREAGVFDRANQLVDKHQERAERIADDLPSDELRRLAYYLIDTVLEREVESTPQLVRMQILDAAANVEG